MCNVDLKAHIKLLACGFMKLRIFNIIQKHTENENLQDFFILI